MASSSNKAMTRGEEDGGQEEQNRTSLDSVRRSRGVDRRREGREAGGIWRRAQNSWSRWFMSIRSCCFRPEPTLDESFICTEAEAASVRGNQIQQSWYHSPRIQRMMDESGEFSTEVESSKVESEIEASKAHWSEVDRAVSGTEHSAEANRKHFEVLRRRRYVRDQWGQLVATHLEGIDEEVPGGSFFDPAGLWGENLVVGEKLAEGGQAEIYAATDCGVPLVVKVFKGGSVLQELEKQFPPALLENFQNYYKSPELPQLMFPILLKDGRFALLMKRCWGDLRKLIDERMMYSRNQGPPFPPHVALNLMKEIAKDMRYLHGQSPPIFHNDLKAANVLVHGTTEEGPYLNYNGRYVVSVADYECSVGVVGTGTWRAPEILQKLKDKVCVTSVVFNEKCDVYSYGMTCYEIVTGRLPYEEYGVVESRECILNGERPELPPELDPKVKELIMRCWHSNSLERPSFEDIYKEL